MRVRITPGVRMEGTGQRWPPGLENQWQVEAWAFDSSTLRSRAASMTVNAAGSYPVDRGSTPRRPTTAVRALDSIPRYRTLFSRWRNGWRGSVLTRRFPVRVGGGRPCQRRAASMDGYASGFYPGEQGSSPWRRTAGRSTGRAHQPHELCTDGFDSHTRPQPC